MKWSETAWQQIEPIYQSIIEMPFIQELSNGSLPKDKFRFYMAQDAIYLEHFGRTLSLIGAKAHDINDALAFIRFAETAIVVERTLHESYFEDFGVTDKGTIQPACHHYIHFLRSTTALESIEVGMAAVLPCFWIYQRVGDHIVGQQPSANNPYQKWIDTYGGEDFAKAVKAAIDICDSAADNTTPQIQKRMTEALITSSHLEFDFWEAAFVGREWR